MPQYERSVILEINHEEAQYAWDSRCCRITDCCALSLQWSQKNVALSLDSAEARIGRPGTALSVAGVHRRAYRRAARSTVYGQAPQALLVTALAGIRRLWLPGLFLFRTVRAVLWNWLRLWVVLRWLRLSRLLHRTLQSGALFRLRVALVARCVLLGILRSDVVPSIRCFSRTARCVFACVLSAIFLLATLGAAQPSPNRC